MVKLASIPIKPLQLTLKKETEYAGWKRDLWGNGGATNKKDP